MSEMGSHDPFRHLKHKLWPKERSGVKLAIWLPTIQNWESPSFLCVKGDVPHTIGKLSMRATMLLQNAFQLEVCTQSYGPPKLRKSQLWEFGDSHLVVPGQNDIWVLVLWPSIEYTIKGKVVASPKSKPWWILWICVYPWFVCAPKCYIMH
jgi:hypothetical protein